MPTSNILFILLLSFSCVFGQQTIIGAFIKNEDTSPISEDELREFRRPLLYPINATTHELQHINPQQSSITKSLGFRLPYFGFAYNYTNVAYDGFVFFSDLPQVSHWPVTFPTPSWPDDNDPALIAPFFGDMQTGEVSIQNPTRAVPDPYDRLRPGVYYRHIDLTNTKEGHTPNREAVKLKKKIEADFREGMPGAETFTAEHAIIVSWVGMTMRNSEDSKRVNTIQLVLATDQSNTYAMFNYEKINWVSHFDITEGQNGKAAYVGFNAGNGSMSYELLPYSQNILMKQIQYEGYGNGKEGRYFFKIDEEIFCGSCLDTKRNPDMPEIMRLTVNPTNGNMLGGTVVNVTGPCFDEKTVIRCSFYDKVVKGTYVSRNIATCIQPTVNFYGYVRVSVAVGKGSFVFQEDYYIEPPDLATSSIVVEGTEDTLEKPETVTIKWKNTFLTTTPGVRLTLSLWGYRETEVAGLTYISDLSDTGAIANDEMVYILNTQEFKDRDDGDQTDLQFGFVMLNVTDPQMIGLKESPYIWSRPMPLAWYFWPQWEREAEDDDEGYKAVKCNDWYEKEQTKNDFAHELPECPCTLSQALADRGTFVPDQDCNTADKKCDIFNQGAMHCVRSGQPSEQGAGQQCCYDKFGELMHTSDFYHAGRASRSFMYGQYPYTKREFVPTLSTWKYDVMPFFMCCKWDKEGDNSENCAKFKRRRSSQDCVGYRSPAIASVFGDPHFMTFDGLTYTFNGLGEYTLLHIGNTWADMDIQGRFEQVFKDPYSTFDSEKLPATMLTGVVAKSNGSETVEIYLRSPVARWRYHLSVYVGGRYVFFGSDVFKMQSYKGVTVYVSEAINNQSQVNAMFHNGAGIEVSEVRGYMSVRVFAPFIFMNGTKGLLGTYTKLLNDEFMLPDDRLASVPSVNTDARQLYNSFGEQWKLTSMDQPGKGSSLFGWGKVAQPENGYFPEFRLPPELKVPHNETTENRNFLKTECGDSKLCQYDFLITKSKDIALSTVISESVASGLKQSAGVMVIRCPELNTPLNGKKTSVKYTPGTTVRYVCNDGYRLIGHEERKCRNDGLWSWGEEAECISQLQYNLQVAGIALGVIIPVLLIVCIIIACCVKNRKGKKGDDKYYYNQASQSEPYVSSEKDKDSTNRNNV